MFGAVAYRAPLRRCVLVQIIGRIGLGHTGIHDRSAVARFIQIIRHTADRGMRISIISSDPFFPDASNLLIMAPETECEMQGAPEP